MFWSGTRPPVPVHGLFFGRPARKFLGTKIDQVPVDFAITIDPKNPNMVYFSGDQSEKLPNFALPAYRVVTTASSPQFTSIVGPGFAANGTTTHSDSPLARF